MRYVNQRTSTCPSCKTCNHVIHVPPPAGLIECKECYGNYCYYCGDIAYEYRLFGIVIESHDYPFSIIGCNNLLVPFLSNRCRNIIRYIGLFCKISIILLMILFVPIHLLL